MSNKYWRTEKQTEPFKLGSTTTQRVSEYVKTWENRCYSNGIPDEVPMKLMKSRRAPSYKAIALAILRNDLNLYSLGFRQKDSAILDLIVSNSKKNPQTEMDI